VSGAPTPTSISELGDPGPAGGLPTGPRRRPAVLIAVVAMGLDSALLGLIAPLLPVIERRTGAGEFELGLALAAYAIPILFVSLPLGRLADSVGRRPVLVAGLLLIAVGSAVIAASTSLLPLIVGRGVQGVGSAASWIAALALISDFAPREKKGEAIGFALAATSVGAIAGPAIGGLTGDSISFEFPFLLVAGLAATVAVAAAVAVPAGVAVERSGLVLRLPGLVRLVGSPEVRATALTVIAGAGALGLVDVVAPLDADQRLGLSAASIGALFAVAIAFDAAVAPIAGRAGDRVGRQPVALFGLVVLAGSMLALALLPGTAGLAVGLVAVSVGISALFAGSVPWLDEAFGDLDRAYGFGFLNVILAVGFTVGPLLGGGVYDLGGPVLAYGLATAAILSVAVVVAGGGAAAPATDAEVEGEASGISTATSR